MGFTFVASEFRVKIWPILFQSFGTFWFTTKSAKYTKVLDFFLIFYFPLFVLKLFFFVSCVLLSLRVFAACANFAPIKNSIAKYHATTKRTKDTKDSEIVKFQISCFVIFVSFVVDGSPQGTQKIDPVREGERQ